MSWLKDTLSLCFFTFIVGHHHGNKRTRNSLFIYALLCLYPGVLLKMVACFLAFLEGGGSVGFTDDGPTADDGSAAADGPAPPAAAWIG